MSLICVKDPDSTLDYYVQWGNWLSENDDLEESEWIVPGALTIVAEAYTTREAVVWVSGGEVGQQHSMVNRIVTDDGRVDDRTIVLIIEDK